MAGIILPSLLVGSLGVNPQHLDMIRSGMFGVCNEGGGTAFRAGQLGLVRHPDTGEIVEASEFTRGFPPIQIAGKTGTAQVRIITAAERSRGVRRNQDLEWRLRDHALFVCFGPFDQPRYPQFWMKNVLIPLDMIFLKDGVVQAVFFNVPGCQADPCPIYAPNKLVDMVIELRGGRAQELAVKVGDTIPRKFLQSPKKSG
jgi:uncharacterized membrane protein (UPF0127 family)